VTAQLKAKTAAKFRRATGELYDRVNQQINRAPEWMGYFPIPGGFPIVVQGQLIGAVAAGGAKIEEDVAVAKAALAAGADLVNDVTALRAPAALAAVARAQVAVCLMHMQGEPGTMQENPTYRDVVREVRDFLGERIAAAERAGVARNRIVVDPGFGFGKTVEHNLALLRALGEFRSLGVALMAGLSRKAMLGKLAGREPRERVAASVAAALLAVQNGAQIVRVHDVAATRDALAVWNAVKLRA